MSRFSLIALLLLGVAGCASSSMEAPGAAPTVDVTGSWGGQWAYTNASLGGGIIDLSLKQDGAKVSGNATITGTAVDRNGPVSGLVRAASTATVWRTTGTCGCGPRGDSTSSPAAASDEREEVLAGRRRPFWGRAPGRNPAEHPVAVTRRPG